MSARDAVLTCVRDEEDVVGVFVQFYLAMGFDAVHVVDNGSADRTAEIVASLAEAGLPVTLQSDPREGYERYLTEWYRDAGERLRPRWLFFLDCDEFVLFPNGAAKPFLDALPPAVNRLRLRQKEMYPAVPGDPRPGGFLLSRRAEPRFNETTKDAARWDPAAVVRGGKHRIDVPAPVDGDGGDAFIRHYKYRSEEQARRKEAIRVRQQHSYSDADLARISAFGVDASRAWIESCRDAFAEERWRASFAPDRAAEDGALAEWAAVELLPRLVAFDRAGA